MCMVFLFSINFLLSQYSVLVLEEDISALTSEHGILAEFWKLIMERGQRRNRDQVGIGDVYKVWNQDILEENEKTLIYCYSCMSNSMRTFLIRKGYGSSYDPQRQLKLHCPLPSPTPSKKKKGKNWTKMLHTFELLPLRSSLNQISLRFQGQSYKLGIFKNLDFQSLPLII